MIKKLRGTSVLLLLTLLVARNAALNAGDVSAGEPAPSPAARIVSAYYISTSVCVALGLADRLVGIEAKAATRPLYALAAPALLKLPDTGSASAFNIEACLALKPDLVILPRRLGDAARTLGSMGVKTLVVNPENRAGLEDMITQIGRAAGAAERAARLVARYEKDYAEVAAALAETATRPRVIMTGNSFYLSAAPAGMFQSTLIEAAGGENVARNLPGATWAKLSYEQIAAMNPDVIVIPSQAASGKEAVLGDRNLAEIAAVKNGRIYKMPSAFEAWDTPGPSCTLGLKWLLYVLHGEAYSLERLQNDARSFYREFYGIDIDVSLITK